jgi:hypothetical protein
LTLQGSLFVDQSFLPYTHYLIILKYSLFKALSGNIDLSLPILDAVGPPPLVVASIYPVHLSKAIPKICFVVALVDIPTRPCKHSISPLLVVSIVSVISITVTHSFLPNTFTISQAVYKSSLEITAVKPIVLTVA